MRCAVLVALLFVAQICGVEAVIPATVSEPRGQSAEVGGTCVSFAQTLLSCPNYLATVPLCGICLALPLYACCLPLSAVLYCCGFALPLLEFLCFRLPVMIGRALTQIAKILLLGTRACLEAPGMCIADLGVLFRDLVELPSIIC